MKISQKIIRDIVNESLASYLISEKFSVEEIISILKDREEEEFEPYQQPAIKRREGG